MSIAKHLPAGCAIRLSVETDVTHVAGLLRPADRAEIKSLEGRPAGEVLLSAIGEPGPGRARTLTIREQPVVLYGIVPCEGLGGSATPWIATIDRLEDGELMDIMWLSRMQIDFWQHRWPTLRVVCDVRNLFHRQWLQWLGFEVQGRVRSFGAAGVPFDLYQRDTPPRDRSSRELRS